MHSSRKWWATPLSIAYDHVRAQNEMTYSYMELLVYIASLAGLERPYEESVGLGSYTDQKAVVLSKTKVITRTNFLGGCFIKKKKKKKKKKMENCIFANFCISL